VGPALTVQNLSVAYEGRPVLRGVSLTCAGGEVVGVVGPNGAGKSTLFKAVLGLVPTAAGSVLVFGAPVSQRRDRLAYLPQRELIDWDFPATVRDVVLMGRVPRIGWLRRVSRSDRARVESALAEVGLSKLGDRAIGRLSGGQQQRVFLARALAQEADLLLLDEPLVGVDASTEEVIHETLARLRQQGRTVLVIDHDLSDVSRYDRVALLNGRLVAYGPPAEVFTRENLRRTYGGRLIFLDRVAEQPGVVG
jgi:manganese/zinc/iron transport system ATP- binding protein